MDMNKNNKYDKASIIEDIVKELKKSRLSLWFISYKNVFRKG